MQKLFVQLEVNRTCGINSAILIGKNKKMQYSSIVTSNTAILKY